MSLALAARLRLETETAGGREVVRAYLGERELRLTTELLEALVALQRGTPLSPSQRALLLAEQVLALVPPADGGEAAVAATRADRRWRALSPRALIELVPLAHATGSRALAPEASLPISLFVLPAELARLQRLAGTLRGAWRRLLQVSHGRGQLVDEGAATAILVALCQDELAADPALAALFSVEREPFRLVPRAPLQRSGLQPPRWELRLHADRLPSSRTGSLRFSCSTEALAAVGRLLGRLGRGLPGAELRDELARLPAGTEPLARALALPASAFLVDAPTSPPSLLPGEVAHLGHATLLANLGGACVLVDPWLPAASAEDVLPTLSPAALPPLAGIFITHHHWDHVHVETLLKLDKDTPVYLPRQPGGRLLVPQTAQLLAALGFQSVHELAPGDEVRVADQGWVVAAPFFGEDPTQLGYAGCSYVLVHAGAAALAHADSSRDSDGESLATGGRAAQLVARFGPLSPVLATRRQERGAMIEHPWEFLLQPARSWVTPTENCCNDAAFLAALCAACKARELVLYAEGGADCFPTDTDFLRRPSAPARMAPYEYLWDSLDGITRAVGAVGARVHLSQPYQVFRIGGEPGLLRSLG